MVRDDVAGCWCMYVGFLPTRVSVKCVNIFYVIIGTVECRAAPTYHNIMLPLEPMQQLIHYNVVSLCDS